jgi:hypothetical protein
MAFAQSVERPSSAAGKSADEVKAIDERVAYWRKTCLQDWDAATHMTRTEWRTTCERVAAERRTFLLQNPDSFSMDGKSRQR